MDDIAQSAASADAAVFLDREEHRDFAPAPGDDKRLSSFHFTEYSAELAA